MNAPDKNINQHPDFNKSDAAIDPNALHSFKNSKKIYVEGKHNIKVPFREISLSDTASQFGAEKNNPVVVYDTSGPYTDPGYQIDIRNGLPALRSQWILDRADVEEFQRLILKLEEADLRNRLCKQKVHRCSLQLEEVYEHLNDIRDPD